MVEAGRDEAERRGDEEKVESVNIGTRKENCVIRKKREVAGDARAGPRFFFFALSEEEEKETERTARERATHNSFVSSSFAKRELWLPFFLQLRIVTPSARFLDLSLFQLRTT